MTSDEFESKFKRRVRNAATASQYVTAAHIKEASLIYLNLLRYAGYVSLREQTLRSCN